MLYYKNETLIAILEFFPVCIVFDWFYNPTVYFLSFYNKFYLSQIAQ